MKELKKHWSLLILNLLTHVIFFPPYIEVFLRALYWLLNILFMQIFHNSYKNLLLGINVKILKDLTNIHEYSYKYKNMKHKRYYIFPINNPT